MNWLVNHSYVIPLLPLLGAIISGFFGAKWLKENSHWPIWIGVGLAAVYSLTMLFGMMGAVHGATEPVGYSVNFYTWVEAGNFKANAGFFIDPLTTVMLSVITGIGFFITVFAAGYMKGEEGYFRFFSYLGLFIFSMTCLVLGNNLVMLYLGWEGVGLCSYLLIGYYYEKPSAREAAKKAFLVNRVGDFGFALGIMMSFFVFGTITYFGVGGGHGLLELAAMPLDQLQHMGGVRADWVVTGMKWIPFLLMLGAFGKSAQFPLYVWLPDAMEGPTPVSALIHAATMVTAGVYMIARCGTLFVTNNAAMMTIAGVGAFTALFAATIALRQFDLKKVFAYSTISQLGYMFVGVGVLAPTAAVFHLVTHAFFQGVVVLKLGRGDARDAGTSGHAKNVRPEKGDAQDQHPDAHRVSRARGLSADERILFQRSDHRPNLVAQLPDRRGRTFHRVLDRLLHIPTVFSGVSRSASGSNRTRGWTRPRFA